MTEDFTKTAYATLLAELKKLGYGTVDYAKSTGARGELLLRHDIDMSISAAVKIAEIEASLGMKAHYFVLLRSELYNPFTPSGASGLAKIQGYGHAIGLHLDASIYPQDEEALDSAAQNECSVLQHMIGAPVDTISFHRPARNLVGRTAGLAGRCHTYEPRFTSSMAYVSDSRGGWHYGHPLEQGGVKDGHALQLLTHPVWWVDGRQQTPLETLDHYVDDRYKTLKIELAANCEPYRVRVSPEAIDKKS